jgi:hypothetical protein
MQANEYGAECPEEGWSFKRDGVESITYYEEGREMYIFSPYDPAEKKISAICLDERWSNAAGERITATDKELLLVKERIERGLRAAGKDYPVELPSKRPLVLTQESLVEMMLGKRVKK